MNKIFLNNLSERDGINKGRINWKKSIGCKVEFIYEDIQGEIEIVDYNVKKHVLYIKYQDKEPYKIGTGEFKDCRLGNLLGKITKEFKIEIGTKFKNNNHDIVIIDRKCIKEEKTDKQGRKSILNKKYYKYKCNKCGFECGEHYKNGEYKKELWIEESNLLTLKQGCACCCVPSKVVVEGINDIATTHNELGYLLWNKKNKYKYTKNSNQITDWVCPNCGNKIKNKRISQINNYGLSCSKCSDGISYPEKFIFNVLEQLINNDFETQKIFNWSKSIKHEISKLCGDKIYDFYIENKSIIIETHGEHHYKQTNRKGKKVKTLEEEQENDKLKKEITYSKINKYIVLDCRKSQLEWIKNSIMKSELPKLLNFKEEDIDWLECHTYACNSLIKIACDLWNNNIDITTTKIGQIMKLDRHTIQDYLKKGTQTNLCTYNPKEESLKSSSKNGKITGRAVEIFKDGKSLGIFESCSELERQSKERFGVKLSHSKISQVCNGKQKYHKEYTFKYIENNNLNLIIHNQVNQI